MFRPGGRLQSRPRRTKTSARRAPSARKPKRARAARRRLFTTPKRPLVTGAVQHVTFFRDRIGSRISFHPNTHAPSHRRSSLKCNAEMQRCSYVNASERRHGRRGRVMATKTRRWLLAHLVGSIVGAGLSVPALGQTPAPSQAQPPVVEEIVVTGTRIRTTDQGALPVQTITQEQIQQSGAATPEQFLQSVSVAVQGNTNVVAASGAGATTGGVSGVSLRGLGSQRTLVLINGKRVSGGGTFTDSTTVDVNSIPLAALEKVDVLKDSASAVYGSDAIGGLINFVIRDNYRSRQLSASGGGTSDGGGDIKRINGVAGFGDLAADRYNVLLSVSYEKENSLFGYQRPFASSGVNVAAGNDSTSGNTFPANFVAADGSFAGTHNPGGRNCAPSISDK